MKFHREWIFTVNKSFFSSFNEINFTFLLLHALITASASPANIILVNEYNH